MVTVSDVRRVALGLPGTTEHLIRDRVKFRVKRLVYVAFSRDETLMGFGFPREERLALVESDPEKFLLPPTVDLRYQWVEARMAALDLEEMTELVTDAWTMVVPQRVAREYLGEAARPIGEQARLRRSEVETQQDLAARHHGFPSGFSDGLDVRLGDLPQGDGHG